MLSRCLALDADPRLSMRRLQPLGWGLRGCRSPGPELSAGEHSVYIWKSRSALSGSCEPKLRKAVCPGLLRGHRF